VLTGVGRWGGELASQLWWKAKTWGDLRAASVRNAMTDTILPGLARPGLRGPATDRARAAARALNLPNAAFARAPKHQPSTLERAREKVREKALHYDRSRSGGADVFSTTKTLTPEEIGYKLRFHFGIKLTKAELGALVLDFDRDGDGMIDNAEFQVAFFQLAQEGRERLRKKQTKRKKFLEQKVESYRKQLEEQLMRQKQITLCEYDEEDLERAQEKVRRVAKVYDVEREETLGPALSVFEGHMDAAGFREQLRRSLELELSLPEFSALFELCDRDCSGSIEGSEFKFEFLRLRREAKLQAQQELKESNLRISQRMKNLEDRCLKSFNQEPKMEISYDYTEEDIRRALQKVGRVAAHFDSRDYRNATMLNAFKARLGPSELGEQLVRSFGLRLSPTELGALVTHIDRDGNGQVEGAEFWIVFQQEGKARRDFERRVELKQREIRQRSIEGFVQEQLQQIQARRHEAEALRQQERHFDMAATLVTPRYQYHVGDGLSFSTARTAHADPAGTSSGALEGQNVSLSPLAAPSADRALEALIQLSLSGISESPPPVGRES